jgi:putative GTP pyrophosphokinase
MSPFEPSAEETALLDAIIDTYDTERNKVSLFLQQLGTAIQESSDLMQHVHSLRWRVKDRDNLRNKLLRKLEEVEKTGVAFDVTPENLLERVNDLAGIRILHLYTRQIREIDPALRAILMEQQYSLLEGPFARTWDDEYREFFKDCGIEAQESPTLYTSVHYVVGSASRTLVTAEIQVRTLMEEVWGEVDHAINYPQPSDNLACREQIKVLARVTSSATRLVDAIFLTLGSDEDE